MLNTIKKSNFSMAPDQALKSENQLPFEVDAAVLEQVAEFRRQQQASLELAGPGTDTDTEPGGGGKGPTAYGEVKIDF